MPNRRGRTLSFRRAILIGALALLGTQPARAADPQSYTVTFAETGNKPLDAALKASSQLESLLPAGAIAPFALVGRAQMDVERLQTVLQGFGYYQGKATITIDEEPLDDAGLPDEIEALPADKSATVKVAIELGPLYHLRRIAVDGDVPENAYAELGLKSGDPAVAADVLKAQQRLLTALQERGYALAKVSAPVAYEDPVEHVLDVTYDVQAGPQVDIGDITVTGLHD